MTIPLALRYAVRHAVRRHAYAGHLCTDLMSRECAPPEVHAARQEKLLVRTLRAASRLPGYARIASKAPRTGLLEFLREFPVVDKATLLCDPWRYYPNGGRPRRWWQVAATSGTTGTPLEVFRSLGSIVWEEAFHVQHWRWTGWRRGERQVVLRGDLVTPPERDRPPFWLHDVVGNQLVLSTRHLHEDTFHLYARELRRFGARRLRAYPSAAHRLATLAERFGEPLRFDVVVTGSELLHAFQRKRIEAVLGARVYDFYSMAERVAFAAECEFGRLHVNPEYGIVEIVDAEGRPTDGEGQIVGTTLHNYLMPLVRYRLSDTARWSREPCPCGRTYPVIEALCGRLADQLYDPAGRPVNPTVVGFAFDGVKHIDRAQVAQTRRDLWTVRIVPGPGYEAADGDQVLRNLAKWVSPAVKAEIVLVSHIPLLPNGKYRWVTQECPELAGERRGTDAAAEVAC